MIVKELIEQLQKYPNGQHVSVKIYIYDDTFIYADIKEVKIYCKTAPVVLLITNAN